MIPSVLVLWFLIYVSKVEAAPSIPSATSFPTITYSILNQSKTISSNDVHAFRYAFDQWSSVIPQNFQEVFANGLVPADIKISFESGNHGDSSPFSGGNDSEKSHVSNGSIHLNDNIIWKKYNVGEKVDSNKTDIIYEALHSIGHLLGLPHSNQNGSIMYPISPTLSSSYSLPKLSKSDIKAIQNIYGKREIKPPTIPTTQRPTVIQPIYQRPIFIRPQRPQYYGGITTRRTPSPIFFLITQRPPSITVKPITTTTKPPQTFFQTSTKIFTLKPATELPHRPLSTVRITTQRSQAATTTRRSSIFG